MVHQLVAFNSKSLIYGKTDMGSFTNCTTDTGIRNTSNAQSQNDLKDSKKESENVKYTAWE